MSEYSGGCACGAVRYTASAEPSFSFHCQCRQCQRASGGGHASLMVFPRAAVELLGDVDWFDQTADDGATVSRGFCGDCGSPVVGRSSGHPDVLMIVAGSLDDPAQFHPQKVVFSASRQPWDFVDPELPTA